jgi:hypothetical protein
MTRVISTISTVLLVLAGLMAVVPSAAAGQFKKPVYYKLNSAAPARIISAEFTNDRNLDLAVADYGSSQVGILLGKGNGKFQPARYFSAPSAFDLAAGDFNGDGNLDLAVVEPGGTGSSALSIFLGDGKGNFRESATYQTGVQSTSVAVADFDGDGKLDVAVTNELGYGKDGKKGSVMVFFGKGDGTFKTPVTYILSGGPLGVAAGDFNGDHHPDLVVAEVTSGSVAILMNDGHGKFKHTGTYGANGPNAVAINDLGNGEEDIVASDPGGQSVAVLVGNGDGTFGKATIYSTSQLGGGGPNAVVVADFNRDGSPDIAVPISEGEGIALLYGNGDGTFRDPVIAARPSGAPAGLAQGDFNKDGAPDLAVSEEGEIGVAVLINAR